MKNLVMVLRGLRDMTPVLFRTWGVVFPWHLARCALSVGRRMQGTSWSERDDAEAEFAKAFALLPVLYLAIRERDPELARGLVAAVVRGQNEAFVREAGLDSIPDDVARWQRYYELLNEQVGDFSQHELVRCTPEEKRYRVHRCIYLDVARELGAGELVTTICDGDEDVLGDMLEGHRFGRDGDHRNTLAHGADACEYVWERVDA